MNEEKPKDYISKPEEINLLTLFYFIKKVYESLARKISNLINLIERNIKFFVMMVTLGIALGLIYCFTAPKVYNSQAVITSKLLDNEYCASLINDLRSLTLEHNHEILAQQLRLPQEITKQIVDIQYEKFTINTPDSLGGTPFGVSVKVKSYDILDTVEYALMTYLENNPFALKRKSAKMTILGELSRKIGSELVELDSLTRVVNQGLMAAQLNKDGKIVGINYLNPIDTYKEIIDLYLQRLEITERMALMSNFELVQGFSKRYKPVSPRRIVDTAKFALAFFLLAIYLVRRKEKRKLKSAIESQKSLEVVAV